MFRRRSQAVLLTAVTFAVLALSATMAAAHPDHAPGGGKGPVGARTTSLPTTEQNVEVVSKLQLSGVSPGAVSDVGVHNGYAYLGRFASPDCPGSGVWIVDISDPANPREVTFLDTGDANFTGEGVQAVTLDTPTFSGDVLILSNELCGQPGPETRGGATLVDVSDPERGTPILSHFGDLDVESGPLPITHDAHSTFIWTAGERAYAVLTDNVEGADIFDITDPRLPVQIAEYDLPAMFPQILQPEDAFAPTPPSTLSSQRRPVSSASPRATRTRPSSPATTGSSSAPTRTSRRGRRT